MDTTPKYILMCKKAVKMREKLPLFSERRHSFFWTDRKIGGWLEVINTETIKYIWLPRQDQLQEMIIKLPQCQGRVMKPFVECLVEFEEWWHNDKGNVEFDSMEQLWLGFVMKEKYNKIWNEKEWMNP